jgi:hypothetical protein
VGAVEVAVGVALVVDVAVAVVVRVDVTVGVALTVAVLVAVTVAVRVAVAVRVPVTVAVGVTVAVALAVAVGVGIPFCDAGISRMACALITGAPPAIVAVAKYVGAAVPAEGASRSPSPTVKPSFDDILSSR